jgi:cell division protein FtsQ
MDGGGRFLRPLSAGFSGRSGVSVPSRKLPRLFGTALTLAFFALIAVTGTIVGGHVQAFREQYGEPRHAFARLLGLGLDQITISGIAQLTEAEVLAAAGISTKVSLAFLDAAEVRDRLERLPLVKSASVRKLYPNELVITLTEREPYALWQRNGELFLIAADGTVIDGMHDGRFAHLPLVVGEDANKRTKDYLGLLEAAGPLRDRVVAGTLVAGRRWTLKIDNGIDVRLPETGAPAAVARLAKLEREQNILDKDVIAIDLRMSDRVVVRLTEEAMAERLESLKKKPARGKGVET